MYIHSIDDIYRRKFIAIPVIIYTFFYYKQHFYKQRQAEISKKLSKS